MAEKLMIFNASKGGYDSYKATPDQTPERETEIKDLITSQHARGIKTVIVSDSYHWKDHYGKDDSGNDTFSSPGIAEHFGFETALHTPIDDPYLNSIGRAGIGLTVLTDYEIGESEVVRVGDPDHARNVILAKLLTPIGQLSLAAGYFSEKDPAARWNQATGTQAALDGPYPYRAEGAAIVAGDTNSLRRHDRYKRFLQRAASSAVHLGARATQALDVFGKKMEYVSDTLASLDTRTVPEYMKHHGFADLDAGPTYFPPFMPVAMLDPDHIFHRNLKVINGYTVGNRRISDHKAMVIEFDIPSLDKQ